MNTVIIFDQFGEANIKFFNFEGDYTKFEGQYINTYADSDEKQELLTELYNFLYQENGIFKYPALDKFPVESVNKETKVIVCGFMP